MKNKKNKRRQSMSDQVIRLLGMQMDLDSSAWTRDTLLEEIGLESFDIIDFLFILEDEFSVELEYQHSIKTSNWTTIGHIVAALEQHLAFAQETSGTTHRVAA